MPLTVKRRVQVTGGSTYIVSLPKEWAKLLEVNKGDEVTLELGSDGLIKIRPPRTLRRPQQRQVEITLSDGYSDAVFLMEVLSSYLAGYDTIGITFKDGQSELAERVANQVKSKAIGLELLDESDGHLVLRIVVDPTSISPQSALDNMIKVVKGMIDDVEDVLKGLKGKDVLEAVVRRDDLVDKLYLYIFKQLNLALQGALEPRALGMSGLAEAIGIYSEVKSLERIADQVVSIAQWLIEYQGRVSDSLGKLFSDVNEEVKRVIKLTGDIRPEAIRDSYEALHKFSSRIYSEYVKARSTGCANECYPLFDGMRRIVAQAVDLLEALMGLYMIRGASFAGADLATL